MANLFRPGLIISSSRAMHKLRRIPPTGQVLVQEGDEVLPDDIVGYLNPQGYVFTVRMAAELSISPFDVPDAMLKSVGDTVQRGEVVACHKSLYAVHDYVSPEDGVIEHVSPYTGRVTIRAHPLAVRAVLPGTVERIVPGEGVVIVTRGALVQGIFGIGGYQRGPLRVITNSEEQAVMPELIKPEHEGCIIAGGSQISLEALQRAIRLGVKGVIVGSLHKSDLDKYLGYPLGTAVTGLEKTMTVVLTEGFGMLPMQPYTYALLSNLNGMTAVINGTTHVRAGVMRPELIIPHQGGSPQAPVPHSRKDLYVGKQVRLIRVPRFGQIATVLDDSPFLHKLATESEVLCIRVRTVDGRETIVPVANLESIE